MHGSSQILIDQLVQKHHAELVSWVSIVRRSRTAFDAARAASQMPGPGPLIRALSPLSANDTARARRMVEAELQVRMRYVVHTDSNIQSILRALQGHWPLVYQALRQRVINERTTGRS
jgi:hypothetical protein